MKSSRLRRTGSLLALCTALAALVLMLWPAAPQAQAPAAAPAKSAAAPASAALPPAVPAAVPVAPAQAAAEAPPAATGPLPVPPVNATAYLVVEATSGQVLAEKNIRTRRDPAALTKLMTAYIAFDALKQKQISLNQRLRMPERAWKAEGSRMFLEPGAPVTGEDLLRGLLVASGNDAAIALAIAIAGNEGEFISRMNREARRLGMNDTQFLNPTGASQQGQVSTTYDLAVLSLAILRDFPQYARLFGEKSFTHGRYTQDNRNRLLALDPNVDGMMTGQSDGSGWSIIATVNRPPRKLLVVVLGAPNEAARIGEAAKLIDWAFTAYEGRRLYEAKKPIQQIEVWKSTVSSIPIGFNDDVTAIADAGRANEITTELSIPQPKLGPIYAGETMGTLTVSRAGKMIYQRDVIAMESAPGAPMWKRMWHAVVLWWKGLFK